MIHPMEAIQRHYRERDLAPRDWKARGRKVVGYICNAVPEELIWAAGMMPVRLAGTPGGETGDITEIFNVNKYTEGFVNTMLNDLVTGKYDYLDYLVLPHNARTLSRPSTHICTLSASCGRTPTSSRSFTSSRNFSPGPTTAWSTITRR